MATMAQLRALLDPEEPDYSQAARLGPSALPLIESLIASNDSMLASKATYLTSMIVDPRSSAILKRAAVNPSVHVRLAAAAGARHLEASDASGILVTLLADSDLGVRKLSLGSVPSRATADLRQRVEFMSTGAPEPSIRDLSKVVLQRIGP